MVMGRVRMQWAEVVRKLSVKDTELLFSGRNKFKTSNEHCDIIINVKVLYFKKYLIKICVLNMKNKCEVM